LYLQDIFETILTKWRYFWRYFIQGNFHRNNLIIPRLHVFISAVLLIHLHLLRLHCQ